MSPDTISARQATTLLAAAGEIRTRYYPDQVPEAEPTWTNSDYIGVDGRAIRGLESRGLVETKRVGRYAGSWTEVRATDEGVRVARELISDTGLDQVEDRMDLHRWVRDVWADDERFPIFT